MQHRIAIPCVILLLAFSIAACGFSAPQQVTHISGQLESEVSRWPAPGAGYAARASLQDTYPIDPLFAEFFEDLGGIETLGPAISPVILDGPIRKQYVQTALLVFHAGALANNRFSLAALGSKYLQAEVWGDWNPLRLQEPAQDISVSPIFLKMYQDLGGARLVGEPISGIRYDAERQRAEQIFENLGFFKLDQDRHGIVHLMALGAYDCDYRCREVEPTAAIPVRETGLPAAFELRIQQVGRSFAGRLLVGPYATADGGQEAIFENMVLTAVKMGEGPVQAKPITEQLGFERQALQPPKPNDLYVFYEIRGGKGFQVPKLFNDYLRKHGGTKFAGMPIGEVFQLDGGAFSQCFSNLCLQFDPNRAEAEQLSPLPLGARYKTLIYDQVDEFAAVPTPADIDLITWVEPKAVDSHETAQVYVSATEAGLSLSNWEPMLSVVLPDGRKMERRFPPTGTDSQTMLRLEPIPAPTGTLIIYEVCLEALQGENKCVEQSFLRVAKYVGQCSPSHERDRPDNGACTAGGC